MNVTDALPYRDHEANVLIDARIKELGPVKSVEDITREVGYTKTKMVEMIRHGESRLPLDRVEAFARALSIDPVTLFIMALGDYSTATSRFVASLFPLGTLSDAEIGLIRKHRESAFSAPAD